MKILFLCKTFPRGPHEPVVSGEVKNAYYLARAIAQAGHEVVVWATGADEETFTLDDIAVHRSRPLITKGVLRTISENIADARAFRRAYPMGTGFDAVINHRLTAPVLVLKQARARHGSIVVNTAHGTNWPEINANRYRNLRGTVTYLNGLVQRWLDRASYRASDWVVSVSAFQEKELEEIYHVPPAHLVTIRNGVDLSLYTPPQTRERTATKTVMFVGRLVKKKGLELILEAAARMRAAHPELRYCLVVGTPEYAKITRQFDAQLDALDLRGICDVRWGVPEDELPDLYRKADVLVAPSSGYESLPTVLLEALATGVPVLTTRAWGTVEALQDERMLLETRSIEEYCAKLESLIADPPDPHWLRGLVCDINWKHKAGEYLTLLKDKM